MWRQRGERGGREKGENERERSKVCVERGDECVEGDRSEMCGEEERSQGCVEVGGESEERVERGRGVKDV